MSKGQITIPKNIRNILGVNTGDRITFIVDKNEIKIINSAIYTLQRFQKQMKNKGHSVGLYTDEDIAEWITQSRREEEQHESNDRY